MLDGVSIWNKFDPFYSGTEWQQLLKDYETDKLNAGSAEQMPSPVADYYDAVQAICKCYEKFGIIQAKTMKNLSWKCWMWCSGFIILNFWKVSRVIFDGRKVRKSRIINFLYLKVRRR